ncbi:MAG: hypothetical protein IMF09_00830 [Proteobacteria bacterium]|nr:hypothetical protein [Pseudomonadota bacterium]
MRGLLMSVNLVVGLLLLSACATESDTFDDKRRGQSFVCHKQKQTLSLSNADFLRHLDHGDSAGPCPYEQ